MKIKEIAMLYAIIYDIKKLELPQAQENVQSSITRIPIIKI
jgi:hypothetical protein